MKKIFALIITCAAMLSLSACNNDGNYDDGMGSSSGSQSVNTNTTTVSAEAQTKPEETSGIPETLADSTSASTDMTEQTT